MHNQHTLHELNEDKATVTKENWEDLVRRKSAVGGLEVWCLCCACAYRLALVADHRLSDRGILSQTLRIGNVCSVVAELCQELYPHLI